MQDKAMVQLTEQFDEFRRLHQDCGALVAPPRAEPPVVDPHSEEELERLRVSELAAPFGQREAATKRGAPRGC